MGTKNADGFTIIEVMLFLAVTGALAIGVLVGSGVAIGQQRYRDSVNSFKSVVQEQYNEVTNVVNSRGNGASCNTNAKVTEDSPSTQDRGTSDCLLLGRLITLKQNDITISNVVGYRDDSSDVADNDVAELKNYNLAASPIDAETAQIEWSADALESGTSDKATLTMLIARSPISSSIFTFASTEDPAPSLETLVENNFNYEPITICLAPASGIAQGAQLAVRINKFASSAGAIEIPTESESATVCGS